MGAYPALDIKTPQQPDLLEKYGQLLQLKNAQTQSQLSQQEAPLRMQVLQQQAQGGQISNQQQQQALTDQQAQTKALGEWDGKNINNLYPLILKNGGSASAVFGLKKQALDQAHVAAETFKNQQDGGKAQIEALKQKNDLLNGALAPLIDPKQTPDALLPQALDSKVQSLVQQGLLDPQGAQAAEQLKQSGDPNAMRQGINQFIKSHMALTQVLEEGHKTALEANQQQEREQAAANAAQTAQHNAVEEKQGQQRISLEGARLAFDKARQGTQDQQSIEAAAQQVSKYELPIPSMGRNSPFNRAVYARALEINPNLSSEGYATNQDYLSSKGKANANIQSFNKVAEHLHDVREASDSAGFNPLGVTGASHALATAQQVFGTEDVKYLAGTGVASEGELNKLHANINSSVPSIRNAALDQLEKMTASAGRQIGSNYERGTKQQFDPTKFFNNQAQGILQRHGEPTTGGASGQVSVTAPDGSVHPFASQAQAEAFKKLAGIK